LPGNDDLSRKNRSSAAFDPMEFLETSGPGRAVIKYRKNQKVFTQGEPADSVFFILEGRVKVTVVSEQGKEAVVAILDKRAFCGEGCLVGQSKRMASARAMTDCQIARIEKPLLLRVIDDQPLLSALLVEYLLLRTIRVEEDLVDQLFNSSEKRLARALLCCTAMAFGGVVVLLRSFGMHFLRHFFT